MTNTAVNQYISSAKENGMSDEQIKQELLATGWTSEQITPFLSSKDGLVPPPPPGNTTVHSGTSMWDAFQHVLLFISLYVYASSFGSLIHTFIDKWLPNVTTSGYSDYYSGISDYVIRMSAAALIVSFPIFAYLFITLHKKTIDNPAFRTIPTRKKLIYITLVITFIIGIFEVGKTIFSLLGGNTTMNFLAHFGVNIILVAIIFLYYLNEVKEDRKHS